MENYSLNTSDIINNKFFQYGIRIIIAIFIVLFSIPLSTYLSGLIKRNSSKKQTSRNIIYYDLFVTIIRYFILFIFIMFALKIVYIDTTSIIGALGIFGLGISLSLQESMKDFVSGMFLIFFDYFRIGDIIKTNDYIGEVTEFSFFNTKINAGGNSYIEIPNSKIWSNEYINISRGKYSYVVYDILISNRNNYVDVENVIINLLKKHSLTDDSHPFIEFINNDSIGTTIKIHSKIKSEDFKKLKVKIPILVKKELQKHNITLLDGIHSTVANNDLPYRSKTIKPYLI